MTQDALLQTIKRMKKETEKIINIIYMTTFGIIAILLIIGAKIFETPNMLVLAGFSAILMIYYGLKVEE